MNTGTILRTILVSATCINTALMATDLTGFSNDTVNSIYTGASIALNFIIVAISTYYNNDYTETAAKHTGLMRLEKQTQQMEEYIGENFFDEAEEIPEVDDGEDI